MSNIFKGGWHPEGKGGKKESWRGDFKGINQIAGKFGKGKEASASEEREHHVSQPLSSLKDPSQFAPPPKHIHYHGAAAVPNATTPDTRGWGAPLPQETIQQQQHIAYGQQAAAEEEEEKPPPGPYRKDTTGLSTANLPKPPVRRVNNSSPGPPPPPRTPSAASGGVPKPAPRLPPRLPPRQNSRPDLNTPEPPPAYHEAARYEPPNQGAMNRLGQAGVSVPGFDIGRTASPQQPPARTHNPTPPGAPQAAQVNELQSRFAKMTASHQNLSSTSSNDSRNQPQSPSQTQGQGQGTTWAQKQAALNTANSFHKDPSKVSFSDAKSAASTANNFRERHGEQVSSGVQSAKGLSAKYGQQAKDMNEKYGITNKAKGYASSAANYNRSAPSPAGGFASASPSTSTAGVGGAGGGLGGIAGKKAAPPPPPPKKREFMAPPPLPSSSAGAADGGLAAPPPLPLSSKPR